MRSVATDTHDLLTEEMIFVRSPSNPNVPNMDPSTNCDPSKENDRPAANSLLLDYLTRPNYVLALFGFGRPPNKSCLLTRIAYGLYSTCVVSLIAFACFRSLSMIRVDGSVGLKEIGMILMVTWGAQALFSSLFVVYHSRRPAAMEEMRRVWFESGCDGLIAHTDFKKAGRKYHHVFALFSLANVGGNLIFMVLTYMKILKPDPWPDLVPNYKLAVLVPFGVFGIVAWMLPLYRFFVSCFLFRYCWIGFCAKIQKISAKEICFSSALKHVSRQHRQLCDIMDVINKVYGLYVLFILATNLPVIILECYLFAAQQNELSAGLLMGWWLFANIVQVLMIFSASFITDSAARTAESFYRFYEKLNKKELGEGAEGQRHLLEATILLQRLSSTNVAVSAWGWFDVSKSGLLALGSVLFSYYIILVQFTQTPACNCRCGGNATEMGGMLNRSRL